MRPSPITQFIRARPGPDGVRGPRRRRVHGAAAAPRAGLARPRRARVPRRPPANKAKKPNSEGPPPKRSLTCRRRGAGEPRSLRRKSVETVAQAYACEQGL